MARLIDADALIEELKRCASSYYPITSTLIEGIIAGFRKAIVQVEHTPTIEAEPVKHGEWIKDYKFLICSNCESEIDVMFSLGVENSKNYCPHCGAKMVIKERN